MNNLMIFENKELGMDVRTIKNEDGSILINAEDTAIGFGWIRTKNNKKYVMWDRMNKFITELNFPHKCGKDDYVPESLFYLLAMKANNDRAKNFQTWLAVDVIPSIRKTGGYITTTENMSDEDIMARALQIANAKIEERNKQIKELKPKAEYAETILDSKSLLTVTQIAKDYGMGANRFNELLHSHEIQYKKGDQWLLYAKYQNKGYVFSSSFPVPHKNQPVEVKMTTKWTQKGKKFLYDFLKARGVVPTIEA